MPWIFKFKCLSRNLYIYTFTAKQEIVLRLRFLSKRVELMLSFHHNFWKDFIYLFLDGGKWRERGKETSMRERNTDWLLLVWAWLETSPATQAHALSWNGTGNLSLCGMAPSQLSHTSQGSLHLNKKHPIFILSHSEYKRFANSTSACLF